MSYYYKMVLVSLFKLFITIIKVHSDNKNLKEAHLDREMKRQ